MALQSTFCNRHFFSTDKFPLIFHCYGIMKNLRLFVIKNLNLLCRKASDYVFQCARVLFSNQNATSPSINSLFWAGLSTVWRIISFRNLDVNLRGQLSWNTYWITLYWIVVSFYPTSSSCHHQPLKYWWFRFWALNILLF